MSAKKRRFLGHDSSEKYLDRKQEPGIIKRSWGHGGGQKKTKIVENCLPGEIGTVFFILSLPMSGLIVV